MTLRGLSLWSRTPYERGRRAERRHLRLWCSVLALGVLAAVWLAPWLVLAGVAGYAVLLAVMAFRV